MKVPRSQRFFLIGFQGLDLTARWTVCKRPAPVLKMADLTANLCTVGLSRLEIQKKRKGQLSSSKTVFE